MGFFGGNKKEVDNSNHTIYRGTGTTWPTSHMKETIIVDKHTHERAVGNGATKEDADRRAWDNLKSQNEARKR